MFIVSDLFKTWNDLLKKYIVSPDNIGKVWIGPKLFISLGNPAHVKVKLDRIALHYNIFLLLKIN